MRLEGVEQDTPVKIPFSCWSQAKVSAGRSPSLALRGRIATLYAAETLSHFNLSVRRNSVKGLSANFFHFL
jgi:hypothetical protein